MASTLKEEIIEEIKDNLILDIEENSESDFGRSYRVITIKLLYGDKKISEQSFTINNQ